MASHSNVPARHRRLRDVIAVLMILASTITLLTAAALIDLRFAVLVCGGLGFLGGIGLAADRSDDS